MASGSCGHAATIFAKSGSIWLSTVPDSVREFSEIAVFDSASGGSSSPAPPIHPRHEKPRSYERIIPGRAFYGGEATPASEGIGVGRSCQVAVVIATRRNGSAAIRSSDGPFGGRRPATPLEVPVEGHYRGQRRLYGHRRVLDVAALRDISLGVVVGVAVGPRPDVDDRGGVAGLDKRAIVVAGS
jgi:hypothetical protein